MIARAQQSLLGYDLGTNEELLLLVALVFLFIGLILAFAGRKVWKHVMSLIGAVIGGLLGFTIGTAVGGVLIGFITGILGSMVGSAVFIFLARLGIGVVAGLLTFIVVAEVTGSSVLALVAAVIAFAFTFAYIEVAIGIVTAVVGGLLVGIGLLWLDMEMLVAVLVLMAVMVFGAAFQMTALKEEVDRKRRVSAIGYSGSVAAAAVAPPEPPPVPVRTCVRCGGQLSYIPEYNQYYCHKCQRYE
jgi:MFS family permease